MEVTTLTAAERLILVNQYRILAAVDDQDHEDYNNKAEIVERGYSGLYSRLFENISNEVDVETTRETHEILSMFRALSNGIAALTPDERSQITSDELASLKFKGFDGNHDDHYFQTEFMVEKLGLYAELKDKYRNSHSQSTLPRYQRQLAIFNQVRTDFAEPLTVVDLQQIAAA